MHWKPVGSDVVRVPSVAMSSPVWNTDTETETDTKTETQTQTRSTQTQANKRASRAVGAAVPAGQVVHAVCEPPLYLPLAHGTFSALLDVLGHCH